MNEPSFVTLNLRNDQIVAVGQEAKKMLGKTPALLQVIRPIEQGVVSNFEVTEKMLKFFLGKIFEESWAFFPRPRAVVTIPLGTTEVEKKAAEDATRNAGARDVFLIEQPMALAIGARLPVQDSIGNMVVNIGAGNTESAVISLGGIVNARFTRSGGDRLDQDIMNYCRDNFNLLIGERTAEELKKNIGSAEGDEEVVARIKGRDLITGLPREIEISSIHLQTAMDRTISHFIDIIKSTIETTPPELVSDIYERGMILGGGGALLKNLDRRIERMLKIPVSIVEDPLMASIRGIGTVLEDLDTLKHLLISPTEELT